MPRGAKAGAGGAGAPSRGEGRGKGREPPPRDADDLAGADGHASGAPEPASAPDPFFSFCGQPVPIERGLDRDLLGEPIRPGAGRRGRPMHIPSAATRRMVLELREAGRSQTEIAMALGISGPTLRLNYPAELGSGSTTWRRRVPR